MTAQQRVQALVVDERALDLQPLDVVVSGHMAWMNGPQEIDDPMRE